MSRTAAAIRPAAATVSTGDERAFHRHTGLRAVQRLDLALLVKAEHRSVVRRVEVQPDHLAQLLLEPRVMAELEDRDAVDDARLFLCARCQHQVVICSRCDRGQWYCAALCSGLARRESLRAANAVTVVMA